MEFAALIARSRLAAAGCALSLGLGVALCLGYGVRDRPLVGDTQLYFYIGERVASGVPPHVSLQDIKTTLAPIVGGMAMKVGRVFGVDDVHSGRAVTIAAAGIATALAFAVTLEFTSSLLAAAVAAAALLTTHGFFLESTTGSSPKVIMVPLLLAAYLAASRRRWAWCGAAGVAAFLCWQPGAVILGGAMLAVLLDRHSRWSDVARLLLGVALVLLVYESYFAWHGALQAQIHQELMLASETSPREFDPWASLWFFVTESRAYQPAANTVPVTFFVVGAATFLLMLVQPRRAVEFVRSRPGYVAFWSSAAVNRVHAARSPGPSRHDAGAAGLRSGLRDRIRGIGVGVGSPSRRPRSRRVGCARDRRALRVRCGARRALQRGARAGAGGAAGAGGSDRCVPRSSRQRVGGGRFAPARVRARRQPRTALVPGGAGGKGSRLLHLPAAS